MKKSLIVLVTFLAAPVFADEVSVAQPLTLASADTSASTNLATQANESSVRLEREAQAASDAVNATIEAKLAETIQKATNVNVRF